jgi:two-component system, NarL family, nitrate/nitrite response regulator NarL
MEPAAPKAVTVPAAYGGVVLLDQDPDALALCLRVIHESDPDWPVHSFRSVGQALERLAALDQAPDLVIVDPAAGNGTAGEFVAAVRERFDTVPILVLSADASAGRLFESIRAGANGYLLKDSDAGVLRQAIADVMSGAHPVSPALGRHLFSLAGSGSAPAPVPSSAAGELRLSAREKELLRHLSRGSSYAEAASVMGVVLSTVQSHVRRLYRKLDVRSRMQAVNVARANGLI